MQKKPLARAKEFTDAQGAIDATLDAWLPSLERGFVNRGENDEDIDVSSGRVYRPGLRW
jgi:hypothetical protein